MAAANSLRSTLVLKPPVQRLASLSPPAAAFVPRLRPSILRRGILRAERSSSNGAPSARVQQDDEPFLREPIRTLILDNYDSYTYNLFQLLSVINGAIPVVLKNDEITFEQLWSLLYDERTFHNVVISPGPGSPAHDEDIGMHHFYSFLFALRQENCFLQLKLRIFLFGL